jgi:hypothetical protein
MVEPLGFGRGQRGEKCKELFTYFCWAFLRLGLLSYRYASLRWFARLCITLSIRMGCWGGLWHDELVLFDLCGLHASIASR